VIPRDTALIMAIAEALAANPNNALESIANDLLNQADAGGEAEEFLRELAAQLMAVAEQDV
jgi:hypothetical protein